MPNWVKNIIETTPEVAAGLTRYRTEEERLEFEAHETAREKLFAELGRSEHFRREKLDMEKRIVDFAMVVPEPERMFHGGCNGQHPHPHPDGGFYDCCWYDWNVANWGTKWNACAYTVEAIAGDRVRIKFESAWSHPYPVIQKLSAGFPEDELYVRFADEDIGSNLGEYWMTGGEIMQATEFTQDEAYDFAARLNYGKSYAELQEEWDS